MIVMSLFPRAPCELSLLYEFLKVICKYTFSKDKEYPHKLIPILLATRI